MKLLYPGTFNPFHKGHKDIFDKASKLGTVILAKYGENYKVKHNWKDLIDGEYILNGDNQITLYGFKNLLVDLVKKIKPDAIVRGLRNGSDLQYEMNMQYWNEDLGIKIPTIYFICDRTLSHISSSIMRDINFINKVQKT